MTAINIEGDVSLDGKLCYRGLRLKIGEFGFRLWRIDEIGPEMVRNHGPHFNLSLPTPAVFQNVPREAFLATVSYRFSGPYLGSMDELSGIPALHEGAKTRIIDIIDLKACLSEGKLTLLLSGTAKPFPRKPGKPMGPNNLSNRRSLEFVVQFLLEQFLQCSRGALGSSCRRNLSANR